MLRYLLVIVLSYLLGSVSSSVLISKGLYRIDIRTRGSGNAGATNVARVFGMASGLLTFAGDILKCVLAMLAGRWLAGQTGYYLAAAACLVGHCFPAYFHFKGGKGVAVGAAIALMLDWRLFAATVGVFLIICLATRLVSLGSLAAAVLLPAGCAILGLPAGATVMTACGAALVIFQHRQNIRRLLRGEEPKFSAGKKKT